jgi:hypothetical protein
LHHLHFEDSAEPTASFARIQEEDEEGALTISLGVAAIVLPEAWPVLSQRIYAGSVLPWALALTVRRREVPE